MDSGTRSFEQRLRDGTETYLDQIDATVQLLPPLLAAYRDDDGYRRVADRIGEQESACDTTLRRIGALIVNADVTDLGIRLSRLHLNTGATIELYQLLDEIPNLAEQFADELLAMAPPRSPRTLTALSTMIDLAVEAMSAIRGAVGTYVEMVTNGDPQANPLPAIERVRHLESETDDTRNETITTAFQHEESGAGLVFRELAVLLDALVDAMEDVTDRIVLIAGTESWIDVDPV